MLGRRARTAAGGSAGAACPSSGCRASDTTAGPPPGSGAGPAPPADAGSVAAPPTPLAAAAAPAGWDEIRHSRPLGSYRNRRPGGHDGQADMCGRALVCPGVAGVEGTGTAPFAAPSADGLAGDAAAGASTRSAAGSAGGEADGAPTGLSGGLAEDGFISAEGDVVLRRPRPGRGRRGGAPGARLPTGIVDADDGRRGRDGGVGAGTAIPLPRGCEPPKGRARPPRTSGGPRGGPDFRGQRARQATADWAPHGGCSTLRAERSLPLVYSDRFGGLDMHEGNYMHWLVTARVSSQSGN